MSIKIVETKSGVVEPTIKLMSQMHVGEVCRMTTGEAKFIRRICTMGTEGVFVIIGSSIGDTYSGPDTKMKVRSLYPNESITVKYF